MNFTQVRLRKSSQDKLLKLAQKNKRSMANMLEILIDEAGSKAD